MPCKIFTEIIGKNLKIAKNFERFPMKLRRRTERLLQKFNVINRRTLPGSLCERPGKQRNNRRKQNRSWNNNLATTIEQRN